MRLAHIADLHISERTPRFQDGVDVVKRCLADAKAEGATAVVYAGDLTGDHDTEHRITINERMALADIYRLGDSIGPQIVIAGNHDRAGEFAIFARLATKHPVYVAEHAVESAEVNGVLFVMAPYLRRDHFEVTEAEDASRLLAEQMTELRNGWGGPTVAVAHYPIIGSKMGPFEIESSQDVFLSPWQLDQMGFDYIALGHIHERQQMASKAHYAGGTAQHTFGELGAKGYLLVDVEQDKNPVVQFRPIKSWGMTELTLDGDKPQVSEGSHVKIRIPAGQKVDRTKIEKHCLKQGALSVRFEQEPEMRAIRSPQIVNAKTDEDKIREALKESGLAEDRIDGVMARFEMVKKKEGSA